MEETNERTDEPGVDGCLRVEGRGKRVKKQPPGRTVNDGVMAREGWNSTSHRKGEKYLRCPRWWCHRICHLAKSYRQKL